MHLIRPFTGLRPAPGRAAERQFDAAARAIAVYEHLAAGQRIIAGRRAEQHRRNIESAGRYAIRELRLGETGMPSFLAWSMKPCTRFR